MNPLLAACGADVVLNSVRGGERRIKVRDFFLGWVALLVDRPVVVVVVGGGGVGGGVGVVVVMLTVPLTVPLLLLLLLVVVVVV